MKNNIIISGVPRAGKSTISHLLAKQYGYQHISIAGSLVATAGGASDILTPVVTGFLVGKLGVGIAFPYAMLMTVISIVGAVVLQMNTTEKEKV